MAYRGEHRCVSCGAGLETHAGFERCPKCGGVWMSEAALLSRMRAAPRAQRLDELMVHNDGTPRRPCPHCGRDMEIAWIDFLQLDRCEVDGVWLDAGELERALRSKDAVPATTLRDLAPKSKKGEP